MTDFELRYSEKSVKEFIKLSFLGNSVAGMLPMVCSAALLTAIPVISLIGYFMTKMIVLLYVLIGAVIIDIGIVIVMKLLLNRYTKKLMQAFRSFDGLVCAVSENDIILVRDNKPQNVISWKDITEINDGTTAFFLRTEKGLIILLEKDAVLSGTLEEATDIIGKKIR